MFTPNALGQPSRRGYLPALCFVPARRKGFPPCASCHRQHDHWSDADRRRGAGNPAVRISAL